MMGIFLLCATWLALVLVSPYLVPPNTLKDLTGTVGVKDNTAQFHDLSLLPKAIYSIGDVECHQIAARSYYLNGNQMPFCARDVGLFIGLAFGFGIVTFYRYRVNPILALSGLVPMGVDGGLQLVTSYVSTNPVRIATGIIAGVALSLLIALYVFVLGDDHKAKPRVLAKPIDDGHPET
jgi:uncharacterized membrane protein